LTIIGPALATFNLGHDLSRTGGAASAIFIAFANTLAANEQAIEGWQSEYSQSIVPHLFACDPRTAARQCIHWIGSRKPCFSP
jgi:hypothetical protein